MKKMILRLLRDVNTNIRDYEVEEATLNISELESHGAPEVLIKAMREQYPSGVIVHKNCGSFMPLVSVEKRLIQI